MKIYIQEHTQATEEAALEVCNRLFPDVEPKKNRPLDEESDMRWLEVQVGHVEYLFFYQT